MVVNSPSLISLFFTFFFRSSICQQPAARAELQPAGHRDQVVSPSCQRGCCWAARAGMQPANIRDLSLEGSCMEDKAVGIGGNLDRLCLLQD